MAYSLKYSYDSESQSYTVTGYSDITISDNVVIPSSYNDGVNGEHPVTSVGNSSFDTCSTLTSITIPDSVTSIGHHSFSGCGILKSVTLGNSVTSIGDYSFFSCRRLARITIPDSVTSIGKGLFDSCSSLTSITISANATSIGNEAFRNCSSLTSVAIPDIVTSIGSSALLGCTGLKSIVLFPSTPPTLGSNAIPTTISKIYVQQSSKTEYQAATNWNAFASKIISDNLYLSFVRFNTKNKEYIDEKIFEAIEKVIKLNNNQ